MKAYHLNVKESKRLYEEHKDLIKMKLCYNNVFNVLLYNEDKFRSGEWRVAYGYYESIENILARHCFIVTDKGEILDPTTFTQTYPKDETALYVAMKVFDTMDEYLDAIEHENREPALYKYMKPFKNNVYKWAEQNGYVLIE